MAREISIDSLVKDGLYEWDEAKPADEQGRKYLHRTPKGDRALAFWSADNLAALGRLFQAATIN